MSNKQVIFFLLTTYLIGNLLLIFIQYNWAKNLNTLIHGNENLVNELTVSGQLKELERDILSVESRIRGTITTGDTVFIEGLENQILNIEKNLGQLQGFPGNDSARQAIAVLDRLVHDKLLHSRYLLGLYTSRGKQAAEAHIATQRGKHLTDSIMVTARNIELGRQRYLAAVTTTIDTSGTNALRLGIVLISFVLVGGAFIFWYIINTIRRQNSLIRQLHLSEKKVREAAAVKENFLANMSHEIRTPMNAILGFTNLLQRKPELDSESRQFVQTIQRSGENLLTLINDILDLSKIEAGMMRIETAPFSIRGLLHSVETLMQPKAAEKKLLLTTRVDEKLPDLLEGDAVRLTQILVNLLGNAIKFTANGLVTVSVEAVASEADKVRVGIRVADTGIGIAPKKQAAIFDRFQQAEDSVTRKYGGTGLGLAIVKELVELQGGTIAVSSEAGQGASFYLVIPYNVSSKPVENPEPLRSTTATQASLQGLRVLIVEDNEINQHLLRVLFRNWNLSYQLATNGLEALRFLGEQPFDLVLMDIQMPEMDGYTATQTIRQQLKLNVPIIAMTAHAMAGEREKCLRYGMNDYLSKPVQEEQLFARLQQFAQVQPPIEKPGVPIEPPADGYRYIRLDYLREVSAGDQDYEKLVTGQFLEMMPVALETMARAWKENDLTTLQRTAHNLKTTISVMGLNEQLQPTLDALEYNTQTEESFHTLFATLQSICQPALEEARHFYASLSSV